MSDNPAKDALYELLDYLEQVETRTGALLQFLRDNDIVTDENFAPYLKQASNATDIKSRAIHARFDFLFNTDDAKPATEVMIPAPGEASQQVPPEGQKEQDERAKTDTLDCGGQKSEEKSKTARENEPSEIVAGREAAKDRHPSKPDKKRAEADRKKEHEPNRNKEKDAA